jgi:type IV pilus assembly protein PilV
MLNPAQQRCVPRPDAGYMLVEVLVTVIIFSVGLLGVAGLQTLALSSSHMSNLRTEATVLASDMAERMRANLGAVNAAAGARYDDTAPAANACRAVYATSVEAAPVACTPAEMAADDLQDWLDQVQLNLPAGEGVVCIDSTPDDGDPGDEHCDGTGNAYAIKVWWTERATKTAAATVMRFATTVRP